MKEKKCERVCTHVCVCACLCTSGTCTKALTNRAVVLIYSLDGQLVPAWNHMGYFIFPKYKPQALDTHAQRAAKAMSRPEPQFVRIVYYIQCYPVDTIVLLLSPLKVDFT